MAYKAQDIYTGTGGAAFADGNEIGIIMNIELTETINYEDVQIGNDVQRKELSRTGEGTLTFNQVDDAIWNLRQATADGNEIDLEVQLKQAGKGLVEGYTVSGVTFDSFQLANWEKGSLVEKELAFRFAPSSIQKS